MENWTKGLHSAFPCVPIRSGSAVVSRKFLCSGIQLKTHLPFSSPQSFVWGWKVCRQWEQLITFAQLLNFELFKLFIWGWCSLVVCCCISDCRTLWCFLGKLVFTHSLPSFFSCSFLSFFPLFLFPSRVQRNIAPCRLIVLCWFVHESHFHVFSVPNKGLEEKSQAETMQVWMCLWI